MNNQWILTEIWLVPLSKTMFPKLVTVLYPFRLLTPAMYPYVRPTLALVYDLFFFFPLVPPMSLRIPLGVPSLGTNGLKLLLQCIKNVCRIHTLLKLVCVRSLFFCLKISRLLQHPLDDSKN